MSRSQKNVRRGEGGQVAPMGGQNPSYPEGVTEKDSAANIAGDLGNRVNTDEYRPPKFPTEA